MPEPMSPIDKTPTLVGELLLGAIMRYTANTRNQV